MAGKKKTEVARKTMEEIILQAIEDNDESLLKLSKRAGVKASQLSRFVKGERGLTLESVQKICQALGLSLSKDDPDSESA